MTTLEERERLAYILGHTLASKLLAETIDVESEKILDLEYEVRQLREEVARLERELE